MTDWWNADPAVAAPPKSAEKSAGKFWESDPVTSPVKDTASSFLGGIISGVPIVGPAIQGGAQRAAAGVRSVIHGTPYADELTAVQDYAKRTQKEHSIAETAGEVVGGVGSMFGLGATAMGARALGITGESLPGMMARGAASSGVIGATDAAVRGEDPLKAGAIATAVGGVAPGIGRVASMLAQPLVTTIRGIRDPVGEASRRVAGAVQRDMGAGTAGLTPPEFAAERAAGTPVNLMDAGGETTRALARSAANTSPEGRAVLNQAINTRYKGQADRLTSWLNRTFHYPNAAATQDAIDNVARTTNRSNYVQAYRDGAGGVGSPELERLASSDAVSAAMQKAIKSAGDEAVIGGHGAMNPRITFTPDGRVQFNRAPNGMPVFPDLQFWDLTRRELSDAAIRAGRGTAEARRLEGFARAMNVELDRQVPSYQIARAGAAHFFGAENALEAGQNAVASRMNNRELRTGLAKMSQNERQLFQDGFVDRYVQSIREAPDRRNVLNQIANSPAARERLALAVGHARATELEAMLRVEGVMDLARGAVQGNSTTARQLVELGLAGGANIAEGGGSLTADPQALMHAALVYGAARGHRVIDSRVSEQVARMLTSSDPQQLRRGIQLLARNQTLLGSVRQADAALASIAARGAEPAVSRSLGFQ